MAIKTLADFKRLTIIGVVLVACLAGGYGSARAASSNQDAGIVAQNETQTVSDDQKAASTESREPGIQTDTAQESTAGEKKPLKDFQPSEQIEAEQAVDFPYDI